MCLGSNKGKIRTQTWLIPANQKPRDSVYPDGRIRGSSKLKVLVHTHKEPCCQVLALVILAMIFCFLSLDRADCAEALCK